ncbi:MULTISPECIES: S-layer family protein [Brevibacillus]|uniref:beta strand repeat-containing protein n=1 Tax=Brevibacillus TaxID=55080 RepID=UPI000D0F15E0|nr:MULTISPECIES: Ig-like domain-containing protein [Brevibacillus]MED1944726.1 Ig-like domain-containing protein [Brevibacillus formosus]MED1996587.1 Ig-like domain-containing protein [Brevibacillus formosus]MED2081556.1 Ig-like domain-containing protein [Brevibacillus formosus]PSK19956.1 hypothetical protein C7R94_07525 [Brevibacillus sp. NRRL NRS-603]
MNKKVVLSVLSTTLVASLAASAFAAPKDGIYIGGDIKKFYSTDVLFEMTPAAKTAYNNELKTMATNLNNVVFVDYKGNGASLQEMFDKGGKVALGEPLKKEDFADLYKVVNKDGSSTATENARDKVDGTTPGELKVESVSAINLNQVKVTFSKEVTEATAEAAPNYTISGYAGTFVPTLLADGKSVILTLGTKQTQSSKAFVSVANVQDADGKTIETKVQEVTFADVTAPTIASVVAKGNKAVVVTLSEPVAGLQVTDFKLNGSDLSIVGGAVLTASNGTSDKQPTNQEYTLTFNNALPAGTHNLQFASSVARVDEAGFPLVATTKSFTVDGVATAPVATVTAAKSGVQGTVTVTFDRAMDAATLANNFFLNDVTIPTVGAPQLGTDGKTVTLTFANISAGANILLINPAVADTYGNKVTTATTPVRVNFTASADTVAPVLDSAVSTSETALTLKFNEALDSLTTQNSANYVIKDANGVTVAPTATRTLTPTLGGVGNKEVSIALASKLPGGTYTITVTGIKDTAGNALTTASKTFTVGDLTPADLDYKGGAGKAAVHNPANHTVEVFFNEPVQVSGAYSVLDKTNWQYKGGNVPAYVTLSAGAGNKSVVFQFTATDVINATDTFTVSVVKDVAGNVSRNLTTTVAAASTVDAPVILNGTVKALAGTTSNDILTFDVDQPLVSIEKNDFAVSVNGTSVTATNATMNGKTVTLTFAEGALADGRNITLNVTGPIDSKNANGAPLGTEGGVALNAADVVAPTVATAAVTATNELTVTFNEDLNGGLGALFKSDFLIDNNGATVSAASSSVDAKKLVLKLASGKTFGGTVKVYPVATPANVQDLAGNKYVPTSTEVNSGIAATALNTVPTVTNPIANTVGTAGGAVVTVDATNTFADADSDTLTLTAASSDNAIATVTVNGKNVVVTPVAAGTATITVTANDGKGGTVTETFDIVVNAAANNVPTVAAPIVDQTGTVAGGAVTVDASGTFTDADSDALTLTAASSDNAIATVTVNGTNVVVTPVAAGTATVTVTANDGKGGTVTETFDITIS